jgi:hypothetical protein
MVACVHQPDWATSWHKSCANAPLSGSRFLPRSDVMNTHRTRHEEQALWSTRAHLAGPALASQQAYPKNSRSRHCCLQPSRAHRRSHGTQLRSKSAWLRHRLRRSCTDGTAANWQCAGTAILVLFALHMYHLALNLRQTPTNTAFHCLACHPTTRNDQYDCSIACMFSVLLERQSYVCRRSQGRAVHDCK